MVVITRAISLTNFLVASSALGFQVFVLYPWHKELDAGFEELKKEHLRVLGAVSGGPGITKEQREMMQEALLEKNKRGWWSWFK
ncbi:hypothetical protein VSDG_08642 [Cytospora chrysosperma]|uniref:Mitochondrial phosphate carrier protein n=1 Tax=Cytospora chrysosperma TaxID=252740 RepID=A0A423VEY4_CYTCH|nr:hypothetical protein VSDG_08642 [Valsa sordida]